MHHVWTNTLEAMGPYVQPCLERMCRKIRQIAPWCVFSIPMLIGGCSYVAFKSDQLNCLHEWPLVRVDKNNGSKLGDGARGGPTLH